MKPISLKHWWQRRGGAAEVLAVALPLIISTGSWTVMNFCDRMFLLWNNPTAMAAALPAGMLHFSMICFPLGVASYVNTFVAQYQGAGRPERIGRAVWQGVLIGMATVPCILATAPFIEFLFRFAGHPAELIPYETTYYQILTLSGGATVIASAQAAFFIGRGKTRPVMWIGVTSAMLNIGLDWLWIFGRGGFPAWGIGGAAAATVVAQWYHVIAYVVLMRRPRLEEAFRLRAGRRFDRVLFGRLIRFGGPSGLQMLVEVAGFTVFLLILGRLGPEAVQATTLAFNVNSVAFMPLIGLGIGITALVGQRLGENRPELAARTTWTGFVLATFYSGVFAVLYLCLPELFLMGHASGMDSEHFQRLQDVTVILLRFVAVYCFFDAVNLTFVATIKGAGDTRFILLTNLIISPACVAATWIGIRYFGWGLFWSWGILTGWIIALAIIYLTRFLQGHWRSMRVIEPELIPEEFDSMASESQEMSSTTLAP